MKNFLESLENAESEIEEMHESVMEFMFEDADEEDIKAIKEDLGWSDEEFEEVMEDLKKRVSSTGKVKKVRSRKVRSRRAAMTTGLSKAALKRRARKSAKARKRNPSGQKRALRKRKKALRLRKQRGLK
tara:strand:- start:1097 stop:1483 length:387 start_codon:yes stop_codon:yes gene_type:complete